MNQEKSPDCFTQMMKVLEMSLEEFQKVKEEREKIPKWLLEKLEKEWMKRERY